MFKEILLALLVVAVYLASPYLQPYIPLAIDMQQTALIASLSLISAVLGLSERTRKFKSAVSWILLFFLADLILLNLSTLYPEPYLIFSARKMEIIALILLFSLSSVEIWRHQPIISMASLIAASFLLYRLLEGILKSEVVMAVTIATLFVAFTYLQYYLRSEVLEFMFRERRTIFSGALFVGIYLGYLRPLIPYPGVRMLIEWLVVLAVLFSFRSGFKGSVEVGEPEPFKPHRKRIFLRGDETVHVLDDAIKKFIEEGRKELLLSAVVAVLSEVRDFESIARIIQPVADHSDELPSKLAFGWEKRRVQQKNMKRRKEKVFEMMKRIDEEGIKLGLDGIFGKKP
jgi:hypothetical protein